jgi:hypothetical protein
MSNNVKIPESKIEIAICEYLTAKGMFVYKNYDQAKLRNGSYSKDHSFQISGQSDLIVIVSGLVVFLEVKTKTGKLSDNQHKFKNKVIKNGGNYIVARSPKEALQKINALLELQSC